MGGNARRPRMSSGALRIQVVRSDGAWRWIRRGQSSLWNSQEGRRYVPVCLGRDGHLRDRRLKDGTTALQTQYGGAAVIVPPEREHAHAGAGSPQRTRGRRRLRVIDPFSFAKEVGSQRPRAIGARASDDDVDVVRILPSACREREEPGEHHAEHPQARRPASGTLEMPHEAPDRRESATYPWPPSPLRGQSPLPGGVRARSRV